MSVETNIPAAPRTHVPRARLPKLLYLGASVIVFGFGFLFLWEPLDRMFFGQTTEARIAEIRVAEPGQPDVVYRYRRTYPSEPNLAITFQHYVSINVDNRPVLFRLSVDSRKAPVTFYNVNDTVKVAYHPADPRRLAFALENARTWGAGALIAGVGLVMLATALPMLRAVGKPIEIDSEATPTPGPVTH
jgi:hypothetical protein